MIPRRSAVVAPLALAALLVSFSAWEGAPLRAVPFERLVSPRPAHWVLDTTGTLTAAEVKSLDARVEAARERSGGEIAVVVIDSTDGRPPRDYATALANRWLIGDQALQNGILILLAKKDRRAEIALGKGIAGEREALLAREILEGEMAPRFQAGDWAGGLLAGVEGAAGRILDPREAAPPAPKGPEAGRRSPQPEETLVEPGKSGTLRTVWGLAALAALSVAGLLFARLRDRRRTGPNRKPGGPPPPRSMR